ncbi:hypothetical protein GXP67_31285 [Rhodocytophaga rosea]|uniref:Histidine kinase n=2 Tax=Rhodocytophaga rosea TaxID=2704465 RepID=A0A6C0GXR3_9BACT|nr:hypothetical protein GXP67_31285 [Rhodocytophaga rosea]
MNYVYALFLPFIFYTFCQGQNQTDRTTEIVYSPPKDTVTSYGPTLMVRNIKQDRKGNILIAGSNFSVFGDAFRYDGTSFTNLTSEVGSHRFWDVLEDRRGNLWLASLESGVYYYNGQSFQHFTTKQGLANNSVNCIYEDNIIPRLV